MTIRRKDKKGKLEKEMTIGLPYTRARDKSKTGSAFFTSSTSMSISFPVLDETITQFFSSALGTNSFPFSSEQNNATLPKEE